MMQFWVQTAFKDVLQGYSTSGHAQNVENKIHKTKKDDNLEILLILQIEVKKKTTTVASTTTSSVEHQDNECWMLTNLY